MEGDDDMERVDGLIGLTMLVFVCALMWAAPQESAVEWWAEVARTLLRR